MLNGKLLKISLNYISVRNLNRFINFSLAIHPNKLIIASGQTGRMNSGRDGLKSGKVGYDQFFHFIHFFYLTLL